MRTYREPIHWRGSVWWGILRYADDQELCLGYSVMSPDGVLIEDMLKDESLMEHYSLSKDELMMILRKVANLVKVREGTFY